MEVFCTIPGNPDIAGIGVRIAIYAQNILSFFPALWALWDGIVTQEELISAEIQSTTNLVLAFAILISSIVQAQTLGLDSYHGNIVLNISWMNNTNVFIYFLLYVRYKSQPGKGHVELRWSAWVTHVKHQLASLFVSVNLGGKFRLSSSATKADSFHLADQRLGASDPDLETSPRETQVAAPEPSAKFLGKSLVKRIVLFVGSFHLTVMSGLGIWLWSRPRSFGVETNDANKCAVEHALVSILGTRIPLGSNALRIFSLVLYSLFLVPGFNLLLPSAAFLGLHIWCSKPKSPTRSSTFPLPTNRIKLAFRPLLQLTQKRRDVLPAFIGLTILLVINLIFVIDIELTLVRNKGLQLEGETQWGFGQILAMLLVLLPLRDIAEAVLARRMKNRKKEIVEDLEMAAKRRDFAAFCRALERGAKTRRAVFEEDSLHWLLKTAANDGHLWLMKNLIYEPQHVDINSHLTFKISDRATTSLLQFAVEKEDAELVKLLLSHPDIDVNGQSSSEESPLWNAVSRRNVVITKLLLRHPKIEVNTKRKTDKNETLLHLALSRRRIEIGIITLLLQHPSLENIFEGDAYKFSPLLTVASRWGHADVVKILLKVPGADPNVVPMGPGAHPLIEASAVGAEAVVEALLEDPRIDATTGKVGTRALRVSRTRKVLELLHWHQYPNIELVDPGDGFVVALHQAMNLRSPSVLESLLQDPRITSQQKRFVLAFLCVGRYDEEDEEILDTLLRSPHTDINWVHPGAPGRGRFPSIWQDQTVLTLAVQDGEDRHVAKLLEHPGIDVNAQAGNGFTALLHACQRGYHIKAQLLLGHPETDVNSHGGGGATPLMFAAKSAGAEGTYSHLAIVESLLQNPSTDLDAIDSSGKTAYVMACDRALDALPCEVVPAYLGMNQEDLDAIDYSRGTACVVACNRAANAKSCPAVHGRIGLEPVKILQRFLECSRGNTPPSRTFLAVLDNACREEDISTVRLLLKRGMPLDAFSNRGDTALMIAMSWAYEEAIQLILQCPGLDVTVRNSQFGYDAREALGQFRSVAFTVKRIRILKMIDDYEQKENNGLMASGGVGGGGGGGGGD